MADNHLEISRKLVDLQRLVVPEISALIELRYDILSTIKSEGPVGRRNLAFTLDMSERQIRNEIEFLQEQKLIDVERQGVILTELGDSIIEDMKSMLYTYNGIEQLESTLCKLLNLNKAIVCPGNVDKNYQVINFMGKSAADYLMTVLKYQDVLALTGGVSTAAVADQMKDALYPDLYIIPARGGIGKSHATQANNVVAEMALKLHAKYELLHLPDNIDVHLLDALKDYPEIKRVFDKMEHIDVFIFGVGRADVLSEWRNVSLEERQALIEAGAVGEAFGYYFDYNGHIVKPSSTIGVDIDDYKNIPEKIAIAGGEEKSDAIIGVCRLQSGVTLITDESAAKKIVRQLNK
jgi:central glycolytic genes regulator